MIDFILWVVALVVIAYLYMCNKNLKYKLGVIQHDFHNKDIEAKMFQDSRGLVSLDASQKESRPVTPSKKSGRSSGGSSSHLNSDKGWDNDYFESSGSFKSPNSSDSYSSSSSSGSDYSGGGGDTGGGGSGGDW